MRDDVPPAAWTRTLKTLAIIGTALLSAHAAVAAPAANRAYTVAKYPVEARAKDAVAAKEQAIADGQKAALRSIFKRIVPVTAYRSLDRLAAADAASLIDGVSVRSERNSSTAYIASLDFAFQPDAVRELLQREGVPYVDTQAPETILVPIARDGGATAAGGQEFRPASGTWATLWPSLDLTNSVTPMRVTPLKPELSAAALRQFYDGTGDPAQSLLQAYGAERVVVAIADIDRPAQRVHVMLAGEDAAGPFAWKRSYRIADNDIAYTLELAAVVSLGVLEGRWKAINDSSAGIASGSYGGGFGAAGGYGGGEDIAFEAVYGAMTEWDQIRRVLLEAPGIDDIRIGSVTAGRAAVSVRYPGGGPALAAALSRYGLTMQNELGRLVVRSELR